MLFLALTLDNADPLFTLVINTRFLSAPRSGYESRPCLWHTEYKQISYVFYFNVQILQCVLIPSFANSFEKDEGEKLIGGPPMPEQENRENMISVFISDVIDPDNPFATSDAVRILLLQFSSLLVAQASPHIHDASNKLVLL